MGRMKYTEEERSRIMISFIQATRKIIDTEGIDQVSIRKIANQTGMNSATMYLYFSNADVLITMASMGYLEKYCRTLAADMTKMTTPEEVLRHTWDVFCRYAFENGLAGETQTVETTAGLVTGERLDERNYRIRLNDPSVLDTDRVVDVHAGFVFPFSAGGAAQRVGRHAEERGTHRKTKNRFEHPDLITAPAGIRQGLFFCRGRPDNSRL